MLSYHGWQTWSLALVEIINSRNEVREIVFTAQKQGFSLTKISCLRQIRGLGLVFPSPDKLLLAEWPVLEAELSNIKAESRHQFNPNHLEPRQLNTTPTTATSSTPQQWSPEAAINVSFEASVNTWNQSPRTIQSPLDRRVAELSKNLKLLEVLFSYLFIYFYFSINHTQR